MNNPAQFEVILLVEDNPGDIRLTKEILRERGWEATIHVATDCEEALDFLNRRGDYSDAPTPDIILLDWHLPQTTGQRILTELEKGPFKNIPLVVLSGSGTEIDQLEQEHPQADAYLSKPLSPSDLITQL